MCVCVCVCGRHKLATVLAAATTTTTEKRYSFFSTTTTCLLTHRVVALCTRPRHSREYARCELSGHSSIEWARALDSTHWTDTKGRGAKAPSDFASESRKFKKESFALVARFFLFCCALKLMHTHKSYTRTRKHNEPNVLPSLE